MENKTFEDYFYIYKKDIYSLAKESYKVIYAKTDGTSITDLDDLVQVASLKLYDLYNTGKAKFTNYTLISIKNALNNKVREVVKQVKNKKLKDDHRKDLDNSELIRDTNLYLLQHEESGLQISQILSLNINNIKLENFDIDPVVYKESLIFILKTLLRHLVDENIINIFQAKILFLKIAFNKSFKEVPNYLNSTIDKVTKNHYKSLSNIACYFYSRFSLEKSEFDLEDIKKEKIEIAFQKLKKRTNIKEYLGYNNYNWELNEFIDKLILGYTERKLSNCKKFQEIDLKEGFLFKYLILFGLDFNSGPYLDFITKNLFERAYYYKTILKNIGGSRGIILKNFKGKSGKK